jgi:hypothetical protein
MYVDVIRKGNDAPRPLPGYTRERFRYNVVTQLGKDRIELWLSYWTEEEYRRNGRWVVVKSWDGHTAHDRKYGEQPRPDATIEAEAVRKVAASIRIRED